MGIAKDDAYAQTRYVALRSLIATAYARKVLFTCRYIHEGRALLKYVIFDGGASVHNVHFAPFKSSTFASLMPTLIASVGAVNFLLGFLVYLTLARILGANRHRHTSIVAKKQKVNSGSLITNANFNGATSI